MCAGSSHLELLLPEVRTCDRFHFAGALGPEFAEPVREVLRIVGCEVESLGSKFGKQKILRSLRDGFDFGVQGTIF